MCTHAGVRGGCQVSSSLTHCLPLTILARVVGWWVLRTALSLSWLLVSAQDCPLSHNAGITGTQGQVWFLPRDGRFELRSSCFHSKYFSNWAISLAPFKDCFLSQGATQLSLALMSLCSGSWPWPPDTLPFASRVLGLLMCTTNIQIKLHWKTSVSYKWDISISPSKALRTS